MTVPFSFSREIARHARLEAAVLGWSEGAFEPDAHPADPRFGDYQVNGVLALARREKRNPRELAQELLRRLEPRFAGLATLSVAGPGFLNFTLLPAALQAWLDGHADAAALRQAAARGHEVGPVVVDYSSPNTAKEMHVGHLRSAVIGEAICRMLEFRGVRVIRDNHLGDWGTQFGKLILAYRRAVDREALAKDAIGELERLYRIGDTATRDNPEDLARAREELVRLQRGDPENLALWREINAVSLGAFEQVYRRLGIRFDYVLGESFYNDKVERVYAELTAAGLATESEGALVVFHPEHPRFAKQPFLVRKSDGAANYASTDLATILYRVEAFGAARCIYVTDARQQDHFEQLFLTAHKWFAATGRTLPELVHVTFGMVLGEDGRAIKTRSGGSVKLRELFDEAVERAFRIVTEKAPELDEAERRAIAEVVGVGSVQYFDLAQNRTSDYVFAWEKVLSLEGNTAPYLLYAIARIRSIFRKAGVEAERVAVNDAAFTPSEAVLARKLVQFPDALEQATATLRPHFLALYLYELTGAYSAFYNAERVLADDAVARQRRLGLCARTLLVLETGLGLLGLRTLERM